MFTQNYIKMCEKAEEIQKLWRKPFKNYIGDLFWKGKEYLMISEACSYVTEIMFEPEDDHIWLPTLEQLFGIAKETVIPDGYIGCEPFTVNDAVYQSLYGRGIGNWGLDYKEILLAFVMKEKYNKIWDGENWIWKI